MSADLHITTIVDNTVYDARLRASWGFAALIERGDQTLLLDTGGNPVAFQHNLAVLAIDPKTIDALAFSHFHHDHTGGKRGLWELGARPPAYVLPSFPDDLKREIAANVEMVEVTPGQEIIAGVFTTGEMPAKRAPEQGLVIPVAEGLVVVTGCAHPGIVAIVEQAKTLFDGPVKLAMGGFHLLDHKPDEIRRVMADLRALGVEKIIPTHCTGDDAIAMFAEHFGDDYLRGGTGRIIAVQGGQVAPEPVASVAPERVEYPPEDPPLGAGRPVISPHNVDQIEILHVRQGGDTAFSPDGALWAVTSNTRKTIELWDAQSGKIVRTLSYVPRLYDLAFSADSRWLAVASGDNKANVWNVETGDLVYSFEGHKDYTVSVAFSPDGKLLATGGDGDAIRIWNLETGALVRALRWEKGSTFRVQFAPDGRHFASTHPSEVRLWRVANWDQTRTLGGHDGNVWALAFSPDGAQLASASRDPRLWDTASGQLLRTFPGHSWFVSGVAFSPDGALLASASGDFTFKLWEVASGQPLRTFETTAEMQRVTFSPDGALLATVGFGEIVMLWGVAR